MSDSVRPHGRQSTRLRCPWDSPGKNTGVGWYFLLQCMKVKSESEVTQSCLTLSDLMNCSLPGSSAHGIFQARVLEWVAIAFSETHTYRHTYSYLEIELELTIPPMNIYSEEKNFNNKSFRRRQWHPTPVLLPGKSHGQSNLESCRGGPREILSTKPCSWTVPQTAQFAGFLSWGLVH